MYHKIQLYQIMVGIEGSFKLCPITDLVLYVFESFAHYLHTIPIANQSTLESFKYMLM